MFELVEWIIQHNMLLKREEPEAIRMASDYVAVWVTAGLIEKYDDGGWLMN